jgi:uncharacterized protein
LFTAVDRDRIATQLPPSAMTIDHDAFTPLAALCGGLLIGLASALLLLLNGRIAGISGIVGGVMRMEERDALWRAMFLAGLIAAPLLYPIVAAMPSISIDASLTTIVAAGLLVGIGTRYAAGCTSGHGVCGISRLSARSLMGTLVFMLAGFVTVFVTRHVLAGGTP